MTGLVAHNPCIVCGRPTWSATGACQRTAACRVAYRQRYESRRVVAALAAQPLPPKPPTQRTAELQVGLTRPGLSARRRTLAALRYRGLLTFARWCGEQLAARAAWYSAGPTRQGKCPPWPTVRVFVRVWREEMRRYGAGCCERSFRQWSARYRAGGLSGLCEDQRGRSSRNKRAACDPGLLDDFARGLARGQWPSRRAGYRAIAARARAEGRAWPSERVVVGRLVALCATVAGNRHLVIGASAN